jgi:hypothetical protein
MLHEALRPFLWIILCIYAPIELIELISIILLFKMGSRWSADVFTISEHS